MTLRQYVHRFGLPPASQSNFESLAIDAAALPRQRRRNEQKLVRAPQRSSLHGQNSQEDLSFASMVLFDALALESVSCPPRRQWRAARQAEKLLVAEQTGALKQDTSNFDQGLVCCGSSDDTGHDGVSEMCKISDLTSSSTQSDSSHDPGSDADL
jgi:hypothetical protein